ncbi:hypothetical protein [Pedobacter sp. B4-66]|uniref:hypothetical protein n=1 Tax=Pedobacter sp. B4-66 TaxID=2817280 RepID=UPI001BD95B95|nr:hypothetical protein [Pedobacter sp. B4-66]
MRNFLKITCVFILFLINGCDRCEGIACSTGPPYFVLEIVDAETGINVFTSGKYESKSIAVKDHNNQTVYSRFIAEDDVNIIGINVESKKGKQKLTLKVGNDLAIPIEVNVRDGKGECCTNYFEDGVTVTGYDYEKSKKTSNIIIKV